MFRRTGLKAALTGAAAAALLAFASPGSPASAQGNLRIGMTANDVPLTWGQPDNGFEGYRFMGLLLYDALINFDLTSADKPSALIPGLAESWEVNKAEPTKWTFKLRKGVKFHDGSDFNADAVVFNMDRLYDDKSPQYSARMVSLSNFRTPSYKSVKKIDEHTVEFETKAPDSFWPFQICYVLMASPKGWEAAGKSWEEFAKKPSGTGPWKLTALKARELAEMVPNKEHWDKSRVPKLDKLTLIPMPDPSARTAALLSGQVDWIEAPSPDAMKRIKSSGFEIVSNIYPHIWSWHLSRIEGSPWNDIRVRKAANLAIDRKGIVELLGGFGVEATGHLPKGDPWYGSPAFVIKTDLAEAKKLMTEAGFSAAKPLKIKMLISASGSGQMLPLQMNEYMQQNLKDAFFDIEYEVVEWQALLDLWRAGAKAPQVKGAHGVNISYQTMDPFNALTRFLRSDLAPPAGVNFGYFNDPEYDKLFKDAQLAFDAKDRDALLQKVHSKAVDDGLFIWVVHDVGPRAMTKKVKGFVQARNWFQNLSSVTVDK
ncbi:MAG: ABC transporter substrate-binding protein [Hyphomicrobiaceae bacterium]